MYKIETNYIANGKRTEDKFKLDALTFETPKEAAEKIAEVMTVVEKSDPHFGGFRSRLNADRSNYLFGWDGDYEDTEAVAYDMTFGVNKVGERDTFDITFNIVPA